MASIPPSDPTSMGSGDPSPSPIQRFQAALAVSPRAFRLPAGRNAWLIPLLIVIGLQIISGFVLHDLVVKQTQEQQASMRARFEDDPNMSAEQKEQALERMEQFSGGGALRIWMIVGSVASVLLLNLVLAAVLLLVLNFMMGGSATFAGLWFVACLGWAPRAVEVVLTTIVARLSSKIDITFGPGAFFATDTAARRFASVFDLFDLWVIAVLVVGVQAVTGIPKRKAMGAVIGVWIAWWLVRLGLAALGNTMSVKTS
jgi:hypothetical protein